MGLLLEPGQRGFLAGKTGSGKSQNGMFQLQNALVWPRFILDTKIEDSFFSVPKDDEQLEVVNDFPSLKAMKQRTWDEFPDYVLIRPNADEVREFEPLNDYTNFLYNNFGEIFIYFDELGNWHDVSGRTGTGLLNLLTRGRSRGKTTLMTSQRPSWINRSCLTETDKFYIHRLQDARDASTLANVVPDFDKMGHPPKFHFWHYDTSADMDRPQLYAPVPETKIDKKKKAQFARKWL
jgi:hypothetical protein